MLSPKEIGQRIYARRKELNLTLQEVADRVGVQNSTISRYEQGEIQKIKIPVIESIASALHVDSNYLIGKSEDKNCGSCNPVTFYYRFYALCAERGITCTRAAREIGLSNAIAAKWKRTGATPNGETLKRISEYLNVPVEMLLGLPCKDAAQPADCDKESLIKYFVSFTIHGGNGGVSFGNDVISISSHLATIEDIRNLEAHIAKKNNCRGVTIVNYISMTGTN